MAAGPGRILQKGHSGTEGSSQIHYREAINRVFIFRNI